MRYAVAIGAGWAAAMLTAMVVLFTVAVIGSMGLGPFADFLREFHSASTAGGEEAAKTYILSDEAGHLAVRHVTVLIYATLPAACVAAGIVAGALWPARRNLYVAGIAAAAGPIAFATLVFPRASFVPLPVGVSGSIGMLAALLVARLLERRAQSRGQDQG